MENLSQSQRKVSVHKCLDLDRCKTAHIIIHETNSKSKVSIRRTVITLLLLEGIAQHSVTSETFLQIDDISITTEAQDYFVCRQ